MPNSAQPIGLVRDSTPLVAGPRARIGISNLRLARNVSGAGDPSRPSRASASGPGSSALPVGTRILIVDDDPDTRTICRLILERQGVEVREAGDGAKGLELAHAWQPHLILLDLSMPRMNGWQVLDALRANPAVAHLRVVILSAHTDLSSRERALAAGCLGYLIKPIFLDQFVWAVGKLLTVESKPLPATG